MTRQHMLHSALLVGVYRKNTELDACRTSLLELEKLTQTYGMDRVLSLPCMLRKISPAHVLGEGKVQECLELVEQEKLDAIVFDEEISPNQQRNLEKIFKRPVLDRTELILEVFAKRAQTKEARLQIELAQLRYQLPRLRRLWSHLSRQVASGSGYLKGEGEKQIELDKRMLRRRITELEKQIEEVSLRRAVEKVARSRSHIPTFAIVGYTNAGKSTLMNGLTEADVLVEDKLFATLDTTTRRLILPNNQPILLTDTVGFIKKIPHTLVAAFKSTLEAAVYTDVLIHLIDASDPDALSQAHATLELLKELGVSSNHPIITVLNKVDRCQDQQMIHKLKVTYHRSIVISALEKRGFTELLQRMEEVIAALRAIIIVKIPQSEYKLVSEIREKGHILQLSYEENFLCIEAEVPRELTYKFSSYAVMEG